MRGLLFNGEPQSKTENRTSIILKMFLAFFSLTHHKEQRDASSDVAKIATIMSLRHCFCSAQLQEQNNFGFQRPKQGGAADDSAFSVSVLTPSDTDQTETHTAKSSGLSRESSGG